LVSGSFIEKKLFLRINFLKRNRNINLESLIKDDLKMNKNKDGIVIKLENISKRYGKFLAVNNINLEVRSGEIIGLVGPNGAGKTTTIKMIAKLLRPNTGRILIQDDKGDLQNIWKNSKNLVHLGFLIDIPSFYDVSAYLQLKYFARLFNYPKDKLEKRIDDLLVRFNLIEWKYKNVKTFSKGMCQKLGVIQAIIHDPKIIILDEPQTGMDPKARLDLRRFLIELKEQGKTIFIASHMLYEISEICDKIALIDHGNIIAFDTIQNLEKLLKTNELKIYLLEGIPNEKIASIYKRMKGLLEPYLDQKLDPSISNTPIIYNPSKKSLKIYYNGDQSSKAEILKILVKEFENDFSIIEYTQPKTSQLERIYSQLISEEGNYY